MKRKMKNTGLALLSLLLLTATNAIAAPLERPSEADLVVAQDGTGDYTTLQAAINAAPDNADKRFVIYIKNGKYDKEN